MYKAAISADPGHQGALLNYAGLLAKWGQGYHLPEALYKQALRVNPSQLVVRNNFASMLHHAMHRLDEAEKLYRETLELQPSYIPVLINLGLLLEQRQKHEDAEAMYGRALALDPAATIPSSAETVSCLYLRSCRN
mmetsp:Transcript_1148/g.2518  ORF Transcript_1148/g.2518 Transcript_1148/m.2518 type:complete len:136 (+) Transcript_1148:58-465(+)